MNLWPKKSSSSRLNLPTKQKASTPPPVTVIGPKNISSPYNPTHQLHVQFDPENKQLVGLPQEWLNLLNTSMMSVEDILEHSDELVQIIKTKTDIQLPKPEAVDIWDLVVQNDPRKRYAIEEVIGEGSYGLVLAATDLKHPERKYAIKKCNVTTENVDVLTLEIYMMKSMTHKNVVEYKHCFFHEDKIWIVMEYMDAGTLAALLANHQTTPLSEVQIRWVVFNVVSGLEMIHSLFRIHRDIKSDNILLTSSGAVKIGDFGFAAQLTSKRQTRNTSAGTTYWMAPEAIVGLSYDMAIDIWSLGIMMMEMAEGVPPYMDLPELQALFRISHHGAPPLKDPSNWSSQFLSFMNSCLVMKPENRLNTTQLLQHKWLIPAATDTSPQRLLPTKEKKHNVRFSTMGVGVQTFEITVPPLVIPKDNDIKSPRGLDDSHPSSRPTTPKSSRARDTLRDKKSPDPESPRSGSRSPKSNRSRLINSAGTSTPKVEQATSPPLVMDVVTAHYSTKCDIKPEELIFLT